jgi:hypothetical protein
MIRIIVLVLALTTIMGVESDASWAGRPVHITNPV